MRVTVAAVLVLLASAMDDPTLSQWGVGDYTRAHTLMSTIAHYACEGKEARAIGSFNVLEAVASNEIPRVIDHVYYDIE